MLYVLNQAEAAVVKLKVQKLKIKNQTCTDLQTLIKKWKSSIQSAEFT